MAKLVKKTASSEPDFQANVLRIGTLAAEHKAIDLKAYDVRGLTVVADCFVICSSNSQPHFKALYSAIREGMKEVGVAPLYSEGALRGHWMLLDYGNIIVHIFRQEARAFYDLDGFWGDAPEIKLDV